MAAKKRRSTAPATPAAPAEAGVPAGLDDLRRLLVEAGAEADKSLPESEPERSRELGRLRELRRLPERILRAKDNAERAAYRKGKREDLARLQAQAPADPPANIEDVLARLVRDVGSLGALTTQAFHLEGSVEHRKQLVALARILRATADAFRAKDERATRCIVKLSEIAGAYLRPEKKAREKLSEDVVDSRPDLAEYFRHQVIEAGLCLFYEHVYDENGELVYENGEVATKLRDFSQADTDRQASLLTTDFLDALLKGTGAADVRRELPNLNPDRARVCAAVSDKLGAIDRYIVFESDPPDWGPVDSVWREALRAVGYPPKLLATFGDALRKRPSAGRPRRTPSGKTD